MEADYFFDDAYDNYEPYDVPYQAPGLPFDLVLMLVAVASVLVLALIAAFAMRGRPFSSQPPGATIDEAPAVPANPALPQAPPAPVAPAAPSSPVAVPTSAEAFFAPYDDYAVTQGVHGASYGHAAIDIAAGNGTAIKSPISGVVSERYVDPIGNTVLVLQNDAYEVTFLHGLYSVDVGQAVAIGDLIGTESNQGNTFDMQGRSCRGRDCGYHTHLNVFDRRLNQNVNPLDLLD